MPRASLTRVTDLCLCSYGCGLAAQYKNKSNKFMCSESASKCPAKKEQNSLRLKAAHKEGKVPGWSQLVERGQADRGWAKGLTKDTDARIANTSKALRGLRRTTDEVKLKRIIYKEQCMFNLAGIIHLVEGYDLLCTYGMYNSRKNPLGVVRDHIISIEFGFQNNIDPAIISHPANCRFITHKDNARKGMRCAVTLDELLERINKWNMQ